MPITLAKRLDNVTVSPTLAISARAKAMKAEGKDVISLSAGEPDFDTPKHIRQAAAKAIEAGYTRYTAVDGLPELKAAIVKKFKQQNKLVYTPEQILVSTGAKQSLYNAFQTLLNPGDEVLIPTPYWVSYPDMAHLSDATPVTIPTELATDFKITPESLAAAITAKTKLLIINSPSNPSGKAYTLDELKAIAAVLEQHPQVVVISDDIYEHICWQQEPFCNIIHACPSLQERTIVVNGVSKAYAMTGWRIGYAAGPKAVIAAMKKIQSQSTSGPNAMAQKAAQAALEGPQNCLTEMCQAFKTRHDFVYNQLADIQGIEVIPADGTFYTFPSIQGLLPTLALKDDIAFAEKLLIEHGVATVPGSAFGAPGHIRLSYASSMDQLTEALSRLAIFCTKPNV
jgi:aspartate aminotransferase